MWLRNRPGRTMALSNAEKQARWRERNIIKLTDHSVDIAEKLLAMDRDKLVVILETIKERMSAPLAIKAPRSRAAADRECQQAECSYAVQVVGFDGTRLGNGVRLPTKEQAELYANTVPSQIKRDSYVTAEVVQCNEPPLNSMYVDRYRRSRLTFAHGTCGSLDWRPLWQEAIA
jgi:hypothetical protein